MALWRALAASRDRLPSRAQAVPMFASSEHSASPRHVRICTSIGSCGEPDSPAAPVCAGHPTARAVLQRQVRCPGHADNFGSWVLGGRVPIWTRCCATDTQSKGSPWRKPPSGPITPFTICRNPFLPRHGAHFSRKSSEMLALVWGEVLSLFAALPGAAAFPIKMMLPRANSGPMVNLAPE